MNDKLKELKNNAEEMQKCKDSACYVYNNYVRKDKDPELTEQEFEAYSKQVELVRGGKMIAKPRNMDAYLKAIQQYPLTSKDVQEPPTKEPNKISGVINYDIEFTDKNYQIKFNTGINSELAANMITREILKFAKKNLTESLTQAKGKGLNFIKDRLGKVTTTEYMLTMIVEQIIGELLIEKELKAEDSSAELADKLNADIAPLEPITDSLTKDNSN